ncbi:hypothetical protein TNCV_3817181 [Trichonephila clavipes]|nr:hypothetical protein TNCV_3817181 [Trichonephila clavipes]
MLLKAMANDRRRNLAFSHDPFLLPCYCRSDSDVSDVEIAVVTPDASELTDEDEGHENEVNTGKIIVNDIPGFLEPDAEDLGITLVKNVMSGNRYQKFTFDLHFVYKGT